VPETDNDQNIIIYLLCNISALLLFLAQSNKPDLRASPPNFYRIDIMGLKPGPKPIAKSTGKPDQRRRDNKDTPGNTPGLKPSKSTGK
jgi:hypothetical protein